MLQGVVFLRAYTNIERWNVSKMKEPCTNRFFALIQVIYQRNKLYCFSNKNDISVMTIDQG
jgi:hypothetical protein